MTGLLPLRSEVDVSDRPPRMVGIDAESADAMFSVLSTQTARALLVELYRKPATLSELADRTDISMQNATYHMNRLTDSGLVEVVDTWYSARGRAMDVYAPTSEPLVFVASTADRDADALSRSTPESRS